MRRMRMVRTAKKCRHGNKNRGVCTRMPTGGIKNQIREKRSSEVSAIERLSSIFIFLFSRGRLSTAAHAMEIANAAAPHRKKIGMQESANAKVPSRDFFLLNGRGCAPKYFPARVDAPSPTERMKKDAEM